LRYAIARLAILLLLAGGGCGGAEIPGSEKIELEECSEVLISVANSDPGAPIATVKVSMDGRPLIYGRVPASEKAQYMYFSTRVAESKVRVRAVSEANGEMLEAYKSVIVKDKLWLVVTRGLDLDGEPELTIEVSYEAPAFDAEGDIPGAVDEAAQPGS